MPRRSSFARRGRPYRRMASRYRRAPRRSVTRAVQSARSGLQRFRQASFLGVAFTGLLLLLFAPEQAAGPQDAGVPPDTVLTAPADTGAANGPVRADSLVREATEEARSTFGALWTGFLAMLPKLLVVLGILVLAWLLSHLLGPLLRRVLRGWHRANAFSALFGILIWVLGIGIAVSVLAGDVRALVGSIGLVGLALSWALQTPIESFTAWLLNSFQGYYREGDRIAVGEVFGDVYRIDFLTTTVWESGGRATGAVHAEQPTGRLITFPNSEVLTGSVTNFTRDFPFVWDELAVAVANESDLRYGVTVLREAADGLFADYMAEPARQYAALLRGSVLEDDVPDRPQVYASIGESWTDLTIRYLVGVRERRKWKSELTLRVAEALADPEHGDRILPVYPRRQIQYVGPDGRAKA